MIVVVALALGRFQVVSSYLGRNPNMFTYLDGSSFKSEAGSSETGVWRVGGCGLPPLLVTAEVAIASAKRAAGPGGVGDMLTNWGDSESSLISAPVYFLSSLLSPIVS